MCFNLCQPHLKAHLSGSTSPIPPQSRIWIYRSASWKACETESGKAKASLVKGKARWRQWAKLLPALQKESQCVEAQTPAGLP